MRLRTEQPQYSVLARAAEAAVLPACERLGMGVLTWSPLAWGFLSGRHRKGRPVDLAGGRPALAPERFDPAVPGNAAKLDAVEQLAGLADQLGRTLPQLAVAFAGTHRAVTSVIIGPRTPQQLAGLLASADVLLDDQALDRIDEIAPPGRDFHGVGAAWQRPALTDPALRRRPLADRAAG